MDIREFPWGQNVQAQGTIHKPGGAPKTQLELDSKSQGREPGSMSVLRKDKSRQTVGLRHINSLGHPSTIFAAIFPGPKEERNYV